MNTYIRVCARLSELHFNVLLFSNCGEKVRTRGKKDKGEKLLQGKSKKRKWDRVEKLKKGKWTKGKNDRGEKRRR